jgi:hypothetical protein
MAISTQKEEDGSGSIVVEEGVDEKEGEEKEEGIRQISSKRLQ